MIRDHATDVGDYWVGPWNNFWFNSVLWNYSYNTPHDSSLWNGGATVSMNWNNGNTWVNQINMADPDGCYPGASTSSSNPGLGTVNVYQAGCSGKNSYYHVYFQPAANAFGSTYVTVNINDGAASRSHGFWVTVIRVGQPPTFPAIRQNDLVRAEHTVTLVNAIQVNDEYTPLQNLTVQAISTSSDAIPLSKVAITAGSGGNGFRNVTITTPNNVATALGTVTLGIRVTDSDNTSADANLVVKYQENVRYGTRFNDETGDSLGLSLERDVDYIDVGNNSLFGDSDFTIESWVYPRSFESWSRILDFGNGAGVDNVYLAMTEGASGRPQLGIIRAGVGNALTANEALPLNRWTHVAAVHRSGTAFLYFDGRLVGSQTMHRPAAVSRQRSYIGKSNWPDGRFNGMIDEVRIWNRAQSPAELIAQAYPPLASNATGLVGYWSLNDRNNTPVNLVTGARSTLVGGVYVPGIPTVKTVTVQEDTTLTVTSTLNDLIASQTLQMLRSPAEGTLTSSIGGTATKQFFGISGPRTFWDSYHDARARRGRLATVTSSDYVATTTAVSTIGSAWIGGTDVEVEGTFKWLNGGNTIGLAGSGNWNPGEPNNSGGVQDYVYMLPTGKWDDADGATGLGYVLESNNGSVATFNYTPLANFNRQDSPDLDLVADYAIRDGDGKDVVRQRIRFNVEPVDDAPVVRNDGYVNLNGSGFLFVPGQNNAFAFEGRAAFTLEAWVRPTSRAWMDVISRHTGGVYGNFILSLNNLGQVSVWREHAPWSWVVDTSNNGALALNAWSHIAATYDGSKIRIYVNGQLRNETLDETAVGAGYTDARIGARGDGSNFFGDLDELRVWNIARSETELRMAYRSPLSGFETGLIGYYRFDEGFGVWAFDLSKEVDDTKENLRISGTVNWITNGDTPTKTVVVPEDHAGFEIFVAALSLTEPRQLLWVNRLNLPMVV